MIGAVARAVVVAWLAAAGTVALAQAAAPSSEALWKQIAAGGHVLLIRHASTVAGFGDPPGFMLGDCATQRNLSEIGREESRRLGLAFRSHRVAVGEVRSSPWCRCVDTATLAFGSATVWEPLASLYNDSRDEDARREAVLREVTGYFAAGRPGNLVLVTHNFNVRSLVGVSPSQAEVIIARPAGGRLELVGRIPLP